MFFHCYRSQKYFTRRFTIQFKQLFIQEISFICTICKLCCIKMLHVLLIIEIKTTNNIVAFISDFLEPCIFTWSFGIKSIINLQTAGEHSSCGPGLHESGFSYDPQEFMDNGGELLKYCSIFSMLLYHLKISVQCQYFQIIQSHTLFSLDSSVLWCFQFCPCQWSSNIWNIWYVNFSLLMHVL